jgi:hypothetical protein
MGFLLVLIRPHTLIASSTFISSLYQARLIETQKGSCKLSRNEHMQFFFSYVFTHESLSTIEQQHFSHLQ